MRNETTEALCRLVTMFVTAIEREGATIPEQLVGQIATAPLKACEELNELALTRGAVDDELDAALAAIYESMDASDARGAVDDHTRERVLRAFDEAHREPEPEHEPEPAEQPAEPAASAQESEQPSEPARKPHRRSRRQRGEEAAREAAEQAAAEPEQQPTAKKEAPEPKPEDRDAKARPESAPKPAPSAASGDVLTVDQAIAVLGVSRPTVYKLIESGQLPAYKKGRSWQISAEAVAARANK